MQNRLDRQMPGSADEVVERLVEALRQQGLTVTQGDTGEKNDVRTVTVTDPDAVSRATDTDHDAAPVATTTIGVRQAGDEVHITLLEPVAQATVTGNADLLEPAQRLRASISKALDALATATEDGDGERPPGVGEREVRRALLDAIHQTAESLAGLDTQARADTLFVLAKAYTAVLSLERTQEIELHLS